MDHNSIINRRKAELFAQYQSANDRLRKARRELRKARIAMEAAAAHGAL